MEHKGTDLVARAEIGISKGCITSPQSGLASREIEVRRVERETSLEVSNLRSCTLAMALEASY